MKKELLKYCLFIGILVTLTNNASAKSTIIDEVTDLAEIGILAKQDNAKVGKTLIVFDIDDTLLEANHFVGSDKWYNWQKGRASFDPKGQPVTINPSEEYGCISSLLSTFFELGSTHLTQANTVEIVNSLRAFDLIMLTARTTSYRIPTERELSRFKLDFSDEHLLEKNVGMIFDLNDGRRTAKVTYQNGVVLSSGLNKGLVLAEVLSRANKQYDYIYFIDDSRKNIKLMHEAWQNKGALVRNLHYTRVDKSISQSEITQSNEIKQQLDEFIQTAYPERAKIFAEGRCQ
ncbi:DUF2608 domain-containing protein [Aliikangiella marina]|uniref:DUF2608 domain-containing protein n=1 Tax=Aliikangiella marina TaxID=1712262 RepID=A0A545THR3_9GAMM|nr:DUF2608 domain-containing protein [Aliikangiella marina]TQV76726.1 DUF2608 domain-containing protein [Aliikangiella marina]